MFSYNIQWGATKKEVERSNFFKEIPKIVTRFWVQLSISIILIAAMVILSTSLVPLQWKIDGSAWAVIFPLAVSVSCHILFPVCFFSYFGERKERGEGRTLIVFFWGLLDRA